MLARVGGDTPLFRPEKVLCGILWLWGCQPVAAVVRNREHYTAKVNFLNGEGKRVGNVSLQSPTIAAFEANAAEALANATIASRICRSRETQTKVYEERCSRGAEFEHRRCEAGAGSRKRKTAFDVRGIDAYFIGSQRVLDAGIEEGWLKFFQKGMRNADGSPRRAKYALRTDRVPDSLKVASMRY